MTKGVRTKLYSVVLYKHIGWFDFTDNSPGSITSVLAQEVQTLNGASTESQGSLIETMLGMCAGVGLGFVFEWRTALVGVATAPFMMLGALMNAKI